MIVVEQMKSLRAELEDLRAERDGLQSEKAADAQTHSEEMEKLQSRVTSLGEERDQLQEILEGLRQEKLQLRAELEGRMEMVGQLCFCLRHSCPSNLPGKERKWCFCVTGCTSPHWV